MSWPILVSELAFVFAIVLLVFPWLAGHWLIRPLLNKPLARLRARAGGQ